MKELRIEAETSLTEIKNLQGLIIKSVHETRLHAVFAADELKSVI
ncbi:hypothetical protein [Rhodohalobacter sp.]